MKKYILLGLILGISFSVMAMPKTFVNETVIDLAVDDLEVIEAFAVYFNYHDKIISTTGEEMITNPQTKKEFFKMQVAKFIDDVVEAAIYKQGQEQAKVEIDAEIKIRGKVK